MIFRVCLISNPICWIRANNSLIFGSNSVMCHHANYLGTLARIPNPSHPACPNLFNTSMLRSKMSEASG